MPDKALDTADGKGEGNRANVDDNGGGLRFDLAVAKHFNHLTLRNGVALAGLGREPRRRSTLSPTAARTRRFPIRSFSRALTSF